MSAVDGITESDSLLEATTISPTSQIFQQFFHSQHPYTQMVIERGRLLGRAGVENVISWGDVMRFQYEGQPARCLSGQQHKIRR